MLFIVYLGKANGKIAVFQFDVVLTNLVATPIFTTTNFSAWLLSL